MNAVDILKYGNQTVLQAIEGLPEADWERRGVCGVWSVKEIIGHLASFELVLVDVLNTFIDDGPTPYLDQFREDEQFNDADVASRQNNTISEVLNEYNDTHAQVMSLVQQTPAETFRQTGTLPWYGAGYDLDDFIVYTYYGHKREHCAQIDVFRDHLRQEAL